MDVCTSWSCNITSVLHLLHMKTLRGFRGGSGWARTLAMSEVGTVSSLLSEGERGGGGGGTLFTEYTMAVGGKVGIGTRIILVSGGGRLDASSKAMICSRVMWDLTRSWRSNGN